MFCQKCGKEINNDAVICVGCGCPVNQEKAAAIFTPQKPVRESKDLANCALIFAFVAPIVGLILGIIGTCKYKTPSLKSKCTGSIFISIGMWIVCAFLLGIAFTI